ncbi:hypothetical protein SDC9_113850 [bioreactor metagenome]|uniref:Uncharacterized protein n=1 Tax=bioreactor metagenome TaxID=1076179 RepID=A0A645BNJ2_9ZZZZ
MGTSSVQYFMAGTIAVIDLESIGCHGADDLRIYINDGNFDALFIKALLENHKSIVVAIDERMDSKPLFLGPRKILNRPGFSRRSRSSKNTAARTLPARAGW